MTSYRLVSCWHIAAPLPLVFDNIADSLCWPQWWYGVESVSELFAGDAQGVGSLRRYVWQGHLPYRLCFDARATRIEKPAVLEAVVSGDLEGDGRWEFAHEAGVTMIRHEWRVRSTRPWMNILAPLVRPLLVRNHRRLMRYGAQGLAYKLQARLVRVQDWEMAEGGHDTGTQAIDPAAAAFSGLLAGGFATAVQIALWGLTSHPLLPTLMRDTQLAAAILLGPSVLPPAPGMSMRILLAATAIHLALSIVYGMLIAELTSRMHGALSLLASMAAGLGIFAVNMYGFTAIFPWFRISRDWITAMAHLAFGLSAALTYRRFAKRMGKPRKSARSARNA